MCLKTFSITSSSNGFIHPMNLLSNSKRKVDNMKKQMTIRIEDGKTIISTGVHSGDTINKTGVKGLTYREESGHYTLAFVYKGKKYHIGNYKTIEEGKAMRKKCDKYIEDGTFEQWVNDLPTKRVVNKLGVKGLSKKGNMYQLVISVKNKKYFLGSFTTPEAAKPVREEAKKHVKNGTFEEWIAELKKSR